MSFDAGLLVDAGAIGRPGGYWCEGVLILITAIRDTGKRGAESGCSRRHLQSRLPMLIHPFPPRSRFQSGVTPAVVYEATLWFGSIAGACRPPSIPTDEDCTVDRKPNNTPFLRFKGERRGSVP